MSPSSPVRGIPHLSVGSLTCPWDPAPVRGIPHLLATRARTTFHTSATTDAKGTRSGGGISAKLSSCGKTVTSGIGTQVSQPCAHMSTTYIVAPVAGVAQAHVVSSAWVRKLFVSLHIFQLLIIVPT